MVELRPSLEVIMNELDNLEKTLCPQGQESEMISCKVYPTRQKSLAEVLARQQQIEAQAKQTAMAKSALSASQHGSSSNLRPQSPNPPLKSALKRGSNNNATPEASFKGARGDKSEVGVTGSVQVLPRNVSHKEGIVPGLSPESSGKVGDPLLHYYIHLQGS